MKNNISPEVKTIGAYLNIWKEATFIIPEYQRAYSWDISRCEKLWQDIQDFIDSKNEYKNSSVKPEKNSEPYFFGTVIISCEENDTKFKLIDGQQRTITFILLLKALLVRLNIAINEIQEDLNVNRDDIDNLERKKGKLTAKRDQIIKILYKVSDDAVYDMVNNFKEQKIDLLLETNSINELYKGELKSILQGYDFQEIEANVVKIPCKQKNNKYTQFFKNFQFFYDKIKDEKKNEYLYNFAEYVLEKLEIIEIRTWNVEQAITMFNSLNSDSEPLTDADIISAKLYSNLKENEELSDIFNEKWNELKQMASNLEQKRVIDLDDILMQYMYFRRAYYKDYSNDVTTPGIRRYYTDMKKDLLKTPQVLLEDFLKVAEIWEKIKNYSVVKVAFKFNKNIKLYLVSYLYRYIVDDLNENIVENFLISLLKLFAILDVVDTPYSSSNFKMFLYRLNIKIVDKSIDVEEIQEAIKKHINENWNQDDIKTQIVNYDKNPLVVLYEYVYSLKNKQKLDLNKEYNIEHIMCQSGKNLKQIQKDAGIETQEEFLATVDKLGNKILLEEPINKGLGNDWFRTKLEGCDKIQGYKYSNFIVAREISDKYKEELQPLWTKQDIKNRTEKIAEELVKFIFN